VLTKKYFQFKIINFHNITYKKIISIRYSNHHIMTKPKSHEV